MADSHLPMAKREENELLVADMTMKSLLLLN